MRRVTLWLAARERLACARTSSLSHTSALTLLVSYSKQALTRHVARQEQPTEAEHRRRSGTFQSTHQQRPVAGTLMGHPLGYPLGKDRERGDGGHRNGRPQPHHQGGRDSQREQTLRECKHQNEDGAGARPQPDRDDRREPACPSAAPCQALRFRSVGMVASAVMVIMDPGMIMIAVIVRV